MNTEKIAYRDFGNAVKLDEELDANSSVLVVDAVSDNETYGIILNDFMAKAAELVA